MAQGAPEAVSVGSSAEEPEPTKSGRNRNWAVEEVLAACMAAGRANEESATATAETRGALMAKYFLKYAEQFEEDGQWPVFKAKGVVVSPEEAANERNIMITVGRDKKDHAISLKAKTMWAAAQHIWDVYDSMLAVYGDTQEKGLPSGTQREEFIANLTLAWHQHKKGGNTPEAQSVPPGKTYIELVCFLKLGPALLGGRNDPNFMGDVQRFEQSIAEDGRNTGRAAQRAKKREREDEEHRERVGKRLKSAAPAQNLSMLTENRGLVASMQEVNISTAMKDRLQVLQETMKYATDDATREMLAKCIVQNALRGFGAAGGGGLPDPDADVCSTPLTQVQVRGGGAASSSVSPATGNTLRFGSTEQQAGMHASDTDHHGPVDTGAEGSRQL